MRKLKRIKQFKIVEQICFILLFSVIVPLVIAGVIVNNINQHSMRNELQYSASMIAEVIAKNIQIYNQEETDLKADKNNILNIFKNDNREIYVIDGSSRDLIFSNNKTDKEFKDALLSLPNKLKNSKSVIFGDEKNTPMAYYKLDNPDVVVIVNTTKTLSNNVIYEATYRIILSLIAVALSIFFCVGLYAYYLYINIRQLFKGIMAITGGNYKRKIRLLTNIFTPYEIIFLANEFNKMVLEINLSYRRLKSKNKELAYYNEFRSNMIDTVSHEFRTPLTSILGYTSRLLRKDIEIDEETREKSLNVIKRQSDRLSRMIGDLLVIPDIENSRLNISLETIDVEELKENLLAIRSNENREFIVNIKDGISQIYADRDRLEQVIINIFSNADKYGYEGTPIIANLFRRKDKAILTVTNKADYIPPQTLNSLFDKFTRMDDSTTRTTRGTGLGLFIVKGLMDAMGGDVKLYSTEDNDFTVEITMDLA